MKKLAKIALVGSLSCFMALPVLADLNDGLVVHYPFNGNANDESGNGNNGTVNGATLTDDRFGNVDNAYSLDGLDDFISISYHESLRQIRTTCAWVVLNDAYDEFIIEKSSSDSSRRYDYRLWVGHDGDFMFAAVDENGNPHRIRTNKSITQNVWTFVCGVYNSNESTFSIYVDGHKTIYEHIINDNLRDSQQDIYIGKSAYYPLVKEFLTGKIDDLRVYNRALSECEIKSLYTGEDECDEPPVGCSDEPATYSNETRQAILRILSKFGGNEQKKLDKG